MTPSSPAAGRPGDVRPELSRPNVLLITCDQMRYDVIAAHRDDAALRTPHLDRLVAQGTSFGRAYTETPVCVPARATALTGLLAHQTGVVDNGTPLPGGTPTFATTLSDAGYMCQAIGKMHFEPRREDHGFTRMWLSEELPRHQDEDEYLHDLVAAGRPDVPEPHGVRHELYYSPQPSQLPEELTSTAWTGRRTIEFLRERTQLRRSGQDARPFLCWTSFIKPHPPFDPPSPWYLMYDPLTVPDPVRAQEERSRLLAQVHVQHRAKWTSTDMPLERIRVIRAYYYALVSHVDSWVGGILDALEELDLAQDTMVLFTADHGEYLGDHWAFGKRGFHDAAARIPLVLRWPGRVPEGRRVDDLVGLADLAPTICAQAGRATPSAAGGGCDLVAVSQGQAPRRRHLVGQFSTGPTGLYALLTEEWKYVHSVADGREVLLAVAGPDRETHDHSLERPDVVRRLRAVLQTELADDGYAWVLDAGSPNGWRAFPPPATDTDGAAAAPGGWCGDGGDRDDRDPRGRGRQYALFPAAYATSPTL